MGPSRTHGGKDWDTEHNGDEGGVLSDLLQGLIIIVGVEVSEVCVGVGLPGQLGVEVLLSFLQDQVVFVESLLARRMETEGDRRQHRRSVCWSRTAKQKKPKKANPSSLNEKRKKQTSNTNQWEVARRMKHTFRRARSWRLQTGRRGGGGVLGGGKKK